MGPGIHPGAVALLLQQLQHFLPQTPEVYGQGGSGGGGGGRQAAMAGMPLAATRGSWPWGVE